MKFNNYSKLNFSDTDGQLNKINELQTQLRNSYCFSYNTSAWLSLPEQTAEH
jgi:hypothetical protein